MLWRDEAKNGSEEKPGESFERSRKANGEGVNDTRVQRDNSDSVREGLRG